MRCVFILTNSRFIDSLQPRETVVLFAPSHSQVQTSGRCARAPRAVHAGTERLRRICSPTLYWVTMSWTTAVFSRWCCWGTTACSPWGKRWRRLFTTCTTRSKLVKSRCIEAWFHLFLLSAKYNHTWWVFSYITNDKKCSSFTLKSLFYNTCMNNLFGFSNILSCFSPFLLIKFSYWGFCCLVHRTVSSGYNITKLYFHVSSYFLFYSFSLNLGQCSEVFRRRGQPHAPGQQEVAALKDPRSWASPQQRAQVESGRSRVWVPHEDAGQPGEWSLTCGFFHPPCIAFPASSSRKCPIREHNEKLASFFSPLICFQPKMMDVIESDCFEGW